MKPSRARAWLDNILAGLEPDAAELDQLIDDCGPENLHHDYKSGAELSNIEKGGRTLRQYAAGFANADGGMLLVGVAKDGRIDGCKRPGGQLLPEWAARALAPQVPYFSPQPRMFVVPYAGRRRQANAARGPAEVLIIAVQRSSALVPCIEGSREVFYFRMGDSTLAADNYLLADLILGRRSHPAFDIHELRFHEWSAVPDETSVSSSFTHARLLILQMEIDNRSLVFAEHVRAGLLTWMLATAPSRSAPRSLLSSVTVRPTPQHYPHDPRWDPPWMLAHLPVFNADQGAGFPVHLGAFERSATHRVGELALPVPCDVWEQFDVVRTPADTSNQAAVLRHQASLRGRARLDAALYVVARGTTPTWFQVTVRYQAGTTEVVQPVTPDRLVLEHVGTGSPLVSWDYDV
jgi:hypothetical protein